MYTQKRLMSRLRVLLFMFVKQGETVSIRADPVIDLGWVEGHTCTLKIKGPELIRAMDSE